MAVTGSKHVLGIVGSPRKAGNTEILVDEVLAGAMEMGATSTKVSLRDLNIFPCKGCNECQHTGKCVQRDDMDMLVEHMRAAHVWVLGSPVYWWSVTAQLKIFLDRWYGVNQSIFQGKHVILAVPLGGSDEQHARHVVGMFEDICDYLGMKHIGSIVVPGMNEQQTIKGFPQYLDLGRRTGIRAVNTQ